MKLMPHSPEARLLKEIGDHPVPFPFTEQHAPLRTKLVAMDMLDDNGWVLSDLGQAWLDDHPVVEVDHSAQLGSRSAPARHSFTVENSRIDMIVETGEFQGDYERLRTNFDQATAMRLAEALRASVVSSVVLSKQERTALQLLAIGTVSGFDRATASMPPALLCLLPGLERRGLAVSGGYDANGRQRWTATENGVAIAQAIDRKREEGFLWPDS